MSQCEITLCNCVTVSLRHSVLEKKCDSAKVRIWQGFLIPVFSPSKAIFTKNKYVNAKK